MSTDYNPSLLSQRFLRIVDEIIKEQKESHQNSMSDSDMSRLLSKSKDRGVIARIRSGSNEPSHKQIMQLAEEFNIDFNAFYRDVKHIYYDPELHEPYDYQSLPVQEFVVDESLSLSNYSTPNDTFGVLFDFLKEWEMQVAEMPIKVKKAFGQRMEWLNTKLRDLKRVMENYEKEVVKEKDNAMTYMKKVIDLLENESK